MSSLMKSARALISHKERALGAFNTSSFLFAGQRRSLFEVGKVMPLKYLVDDTDIVIKEDSEYPPWVFTLHKPLPSKRELLHMSETVGLESMSERNLKLLKRKITLETIKQKNDASRQ